MTSLFNEPTFGSALFNGGGSVATVYVTDSVAFENVSLNDGSSVVLTDYPLKGPSRDILGGVIPGTTAGTSPARTSGRRRSS
jgi:hypothetical protein